MASCSHGEISNHGRNRYTIDRHDQAVRDVVHALDTLNARVHIIHTCIRGDDETTCASPGWLHVKGVAHEYEVKVYSLMGANAHPTITRKPDDDVSHFDQ